MEKKLLTLIIVLAATLQSLAQITTIKGRVVDAVTGEGLIGASLVPKNSKELGVVTDIEGNFTLQTKVQLPLTLSIQYIGYRSQEVEVYDAEEPIEVTLASGGNSLNEVVVVGYGTQQRKKLTGAVASINTDDVLKNVTSFDKALGGTVAGLSVSSSSGQPGASTSIRIRGGNSITAGNEPLYVIDGVLIYNSSDATSTGNSLAGGSFNPLASINPSDIESIEVLKDVSASAIYGSRGSNGVIIVTTKNGKKGKVNVNYGYSLGVSSVSRKLDLLNARQWGELYLELATDAQKAATGVTEDVVQSWGAGTDWQDALFRTAVTHEHQLSISGGSDKDRFLLSANYTDQDGIIHNSGFTRLGARFNYERDIVKNITVGLKSNFSKTTRTGAYGMRGSTGNFSGIIDKVIRTSPAVSIYNADGSFNYANPFESGDFVRDDVTVNPIADLYNLDTETKVDNVLVSGFAQWEIIPGLRLRTQASANIINTRQNLFGAESTQVGFVSQGYGDIGTKRWESDQFEATLTYNKRWGIHEIEALGGYTYQQEKSEGLDASTAYYANENLGYHSLQSGSTFVETNSAFSTSVLYSVLGRINYSLLDRYHLTATLRGDGSSRFAKNHKWGWFPSVGFSWNVNEEKFLKNKKWLEDLKFRASIGTVGNQEIGNYAYSSDYSATHYFFGGVRNLAYYRSSLGNDDLKWESTTSFDLGLDINLFKGRLGFVFDYYHKKTSDLLLSLSVQQTTGFSSQLQNVGNVTNDGVEFGVNGTLYQSKKFNWTANANIAHNKNRVSSLGGSQKDIIEGNTIIRVGESLGTFYGWQYDGIVQKGEDLSKVPATSVKGVVEYGDVKYVDQNGDGVVDQENDRVVLGSTQPKFTYGFGTQLRYKQWDLTLNLQGSYGNKLYNRLRQALETPNISYNGSAVLLNRWTEDNPSTSVPRAFVSNVASFYLDSRYIESASYLRLKNLQIGYNLQPRLRNGQKLGLYLYASAQNLFTITPYEGYDPEYSGSTDSGNYPTARSFTFGVKFSY